MRSNLKKSEDRRKCCVICIGSYSYFQCRKLKILQPSRLLAPSPLHPPPQHPRLHHLHRFGPETPFPKAPQEQMLSKVTSSTMEFPFPSSPSPQTRCVSASAVFPREGKPTFPEDSLGTCLSSMLWKFVTSTSANIGEIGKTSFYGCLNMAMKPFRFEKSPTMRP